MRVVIGGGVLEVRSANHGRSQVAIDTGQV
jgi:hypothetical protein